MNDNCVQLLQTGEQYIILGDKIEEFVNKAENYMEREDEITSTEITLPGNLFSYSL